ncbi:hypothetical protein [Acinetobacter sp. SFB]|uniref:hypothetical protein n=1 Tax=Acinetobacter sp. SFB TaxID=1805634 RepID=UPI00082A6134|nr:hypothetical protein [Acinetobacter sp. SFB]
MAEQENKQALMIQLPWTVPQQPNVQTIVLQQPAKTHMELNASTDKTAISSFALSVMIALILGAMATWLAYWYGRKSFELTKQSFDALVKQIESSELVTLESNRSIYGQNRKIEIIKQEFELKYRRLERLKENFSNFIVNAENLNIEIFKLNFDALNEKIANKEIQIRRNTINENQKKLDLQSKIIKFEFDDSCEQEIELEIILIKIILELTWLEGNALLKKNNDRCLELETIIKKAEFLMKNIIFQNKKAA